MIATLRGHKWVCLSIYTHLHPKGILKWPYANTTLTAHFMCGLMSDLAICKFKKKYGHTWHRMSLLRPGVIKQHKPNLKSSLIQRITMCPHGYHHSGFMVTPALGTQDVEVHLYILVVLVMSLIVPVSSVGISLCQQDHISYITVENVT